MVTFIIHVMRNVSRCSCTFLLATTFCNCAATEKMAPNESFRFRSELEKQQTEYRARHGNIRAARRMAEYSYFVQQSKVNAIYWYKIAALYGDEVSKDNINNLCE